MAEAAYKIVRCIEGSYIVDWTDDVIAYAEIRGMLVTGRLARPKVREELQGQPYISGLVGPMWDGDCIRYEDQTTNDHMSI